MMTFKRVPISTNKQFLRTSELNVLSPYPKLALVKAVVFCNRNYMGLCGECKILTPGVEREWGCILKCESEL